MAYIITSNMKIYDKKYLSLLKEMSITQYKLKDQSTFLGLIWAFLDPLIMLILLFIIFYLRMGQEIEYYPIYLLIGVIQYSHFSNCTSSSMRVLYSRKGLTCNTIFPKEILVFSSIASNSVGFIISMIICTLIAYFWGVKLSYAMIMLPLVIILQLMLVSWVSLFLSCLHVFVRDIENIYQVFLRMLFFITPIFYRLSFLKNRPARSIVLLNPLTHLINFSRTIIIEGQIISIKAMLLFFLISLVLIYLAVKIFKKYEPRFAESL
jgi:ABC-type polysaccharide/polyol phosphate export permease